ncbi:DUF3305 domain-containing protein [Vibrio sp. WXL210]|uniref:DUF3305 domain-containing protein n=1 Tax=Vibrio sp. WXL210 TaxID=3450709 RepID=UPI003EC8EBC0
MEPSQPPNTHAEQKTETLWPLGCQLESKAIQAKFWSTLQWQLNGFDLHPQQDQPYPVYLELFKDERTDYRFNLSSHQPKLFVVLEDGSAEVPVIVSITASQSVAAQFMDGDYQVLSSDMPLPIQAWMEAFIGRHGELIEERKKKKRKGAGRSREQ